MKLLVVGCGSIGRRHTQNLLHFGNIVVVWDNDDKAIEECSNRFGVRQGGLDKEAFDAVFICTPPNSHLEYMSRAIARRIPIFVEKPISDTEEGVAEVLEQAGSLPIQVGYNLRFHPGLRCLKSLLPQIGRPLHFQAYFGQYFPDWRPDIDHRNSYTTKLGIILEASHELDYARWLLGEMEVVGCSWGNTGTVDFVAEDIADIQVLFSNGCQGYIHLNAVECGYSRWCKIIGSLGTLQWNYKHSYIELLLPSELRMVDVHLKDMYSAEVWSFLNVVRLGRPPEVTGEDGLRALQLALKAKNG